LSKSLVVVLITRYGKNKKNAIQTLKFPFVLHQKPLVRVLREDLVAI